MEKIKCNVAVLGAGAGGFGATYRLIKNGIKTIVIDKNSDFGGTAVFAGVSCWESGISNFGVHELLAEHIMAQENGGGVGISIPIHNLYNLNSEGIYDDNWSKMKFESLRIGLSVVDKTLPYESSLGRCKAIKNKKGRFQFEDEAMLIAMNSILEQYKDKLTTMFGYEFVSCNVKDKKLTSIIVTNGNEKIEISADYFIDASGDIVLARDAGCKTILGAESKETYKEPSAQYEDKNAINGVTYMVRVKKTDDPNYIDPIPDDIKDIDVSDWEKEKLEKYSIDTCFNVYPNLDINLNILPVLSGKEFMILGENAKQVAKARIYAFWNFNQINKGLNGYKITKIFSMPGIRESYRLVGKEVLTENDVMQGYRNQRLSEEFIAYGDHALDIHAVNEKEKVCKHLNLPYGIPYSCMVPNEIENMLVACRGASFSRLAASTCRLTRTMMSMGEAAGEVYSQMVKEGNVDICKLRTKLRCAEYENYLDIECNK